MKRKDYKRPTMKVVEVRHHGMLMTSTPGSGNLNAQTPYTNGGDPFEED